MLGPQENTTDLTQLARTGNRQAFQVLALKHYDRLIAFIAPRLPLPFRRVISAEDVLQETLRQALRDIHQFERRGDTAFYVWLRQIARHTILDLIRVEEAGKRDCRRIASPQALDTDNPFGLLELAIGREGTPSGEAARREAAQALKTALLRLKKGYRDALLLRYFDGLSVQETATKMKCSIGTVMMACLRGVKELRRWLGSRSRYLR
jgi:RNA polymerase sigma-70 factor (ECF subfamily)